MESKKEKKIEPGKELIRIRPDEIDVDISSINQLLKEAVSDSAFPGGVILAAKDGQIFYIKVLDTRLTSKLNQW